MEAITEGVNNININNNNNNNNSDSYKKNRIQVSNTKKPLFFYVNLAKVYLLILIVFSLITMFFFFLISFYYYNCRDTCNSIMRSNSQHLEWVRILSNFIQFNFQSVTFLRIFLLRKNSVK
jgi:hypothetical protein